MGVFYTSFLPRRVCIRNVSRDLSRLVGAGRYIHQLSQQRGRCGGVAVVSINSPAHTLISFWKTTATLTPFIHTLKKVHFLYDVFLRTTHGRPAGDPRKIHEHATVGKRRGNLKKVLLLRFPSPTPSPSKSEAGELCPQLPKLSESKVSSTPPPLLKGGEGAGGGMVRSATAANEI